MRVRYAALATLCMVAATACTSSSPTEVDSQAGKPTKLDVAPLQVDFGSSGSTGSVTLTNTTARPLSWSASESAGWLSLGATSGTLWGNSTRTISLSAQRGTLPAGTYRTSVSVSGDHGAGSETVSVSLIVPSSTGTSEGQLSVSPLQVDFGTTGTTASVTLTNTGDASLSWTASESAGWLSLGATSGSLAGKSSKTLSLSAQRSGMAAGTYTTSVVVSAGAAGSVTESVSMTVSPSWTSSEVLLAGRLIDQVVGQGMAGLAVQFSGSSATTDGTGSFRIPGSPTSTLSQLTLSGSGIYRRVTYAKSGDAVWQVVPTSFNMTAFDDLAREEFGTSTIRWMAAPTVYVDARPEGFTGGTELETWISEVRVQAAEFVSKWTGTTISPTAVIVTSSPPRDFSAGTIVIHFSENDSRYGSSSSIGSARTSYSSDRAISGAALWLRYLRYSGDGYASKRRGILGHELGHAMGLGHMNGTTFSLMAPSLGSKTDLSAFDVQAASLLYGRLPGNASPDIDSSPGSRGLLAPAGATVERAWVCDAGDAAPQGER